VNDGHHWVNPGHPERHCLKAQRSAQYCNFSTNVAERHPRRRGLKGWPDLPQRNLTPLEQHLKSDVIRCIERFIAPREVKRAVGVAVS
jgi:hypothetical protein